MWCSIKIALFFFVIGANAAKRKATVRRADHITIGSIENPHQNLSDNVQLTLMQTTTNADGSIVSRWSQEYLGIPVWNGQIAKRESKNRTVHVVDECKGTKRMKHIQGTVTTNGWYVPDLEVDNEEIQALHNEGGPKMAKLAGRRQCNGSMTEGFAGIDLLIFVTDDGDVEPVYQFKFFSNHAFCHYMIALNMTIIKSFSTRWYDSVDRVDRQYLPTPATPVPYRKTHAVEVIGDDQVYDNDVQYRFVSIKHMGRDHRDRADEGVPEMLPKWEKLKVQVNGNTCDLKNDRVNVVDESNNGITASFPCERNKTTTLNQRFDELAQFDLFANANFVIDSMMKRHGTPFLDPSYSMQFKYFSKTSVGAGSVYGKHIQFSIQQPSWSGTYPNTIEDITAHEMGHAFTDLHGQLKYAIDSETGGLNEAFSDITGVTMQKAMNPTEPISWHLAERLEPTNGNLEERTYCNISIIPLRFMDDPSRDCESIGHVNGLPKYHEDKVDAHQTSGVFNHAFYLAVTEMQSKSNCQPELQIYDAFFVANRDKYTELTRFDDGAAAVLNAAEELLAGEHTQLQYNKKLAHVIKRAFSKVGIMCGKTSTGWACDFDR